MPDAALKGGRRKLLRLTRVYFKDVMSMSFGSLFGRCVTSISASKPPALRLVVAPMYDFSVVIPRALMPCCRAENQPSFKCAKTK